MLSKKRARFEKAWRRIEAAAESGEPVEGTVIEVVKGGLILDLGVRGFLPASLVDIRRVHNLDEFMGQKLECKVIELNRSRNNVVLSRRAVLEEERKEVREQILGRLAARNGRRGQDLQHRRLRRLRRPRRDRRADPHLRAFLEPRQPSLRGALDRRDGERQGARHRPRPPADLAGPQADPGGPVAAGAQGPTAPATSSRARSPRSSRSAPSSRSSPGSRAWSTSPSSPSTTSRIPARSSHPVTRPG